MTTTLGHKEFGESTSLCPGGHEPWTSGQVVLTPATADRLWRQASLWLTQAQREYHDAIFMRDGSEASLDRYASARAELDSAEAWALKVSKAMHSPRD